MSLRPILTFGLPASSIMLPQVSRSSEIKLLSANVFTGVLDGPINDFERSTGHKVDILYGTAGSIQGRGQSGEPGDVTIVTKPMSVPLYNTRSRVKAWCQEVKTDRRGAGAAPYCVSESSGLPSW